MAAVVIEWSALEPGLKPVEEEMILEIHAPQRVERLARLAQGSVEIEQPHQARPLPAPIGDGEDWPPVMQQPRHQMLAILPDRFHHHQGRVIGNGAEDFDAALLAVDEAVLLFRRHSDGRG